MLLGYSIFLSIIITLGALYEIFFKIDKFRNLYLLKFIMLLYILSPLVNGIDNAYLKFDHFMYLKFFQNINLSHFDFDYSSIQWEIGYVLFNQFVRIFTESYIALFCTIITFNMVFVYYSIKRYSNSPLVLFFCYFCFCYFMQDMLMLRQGMACAVVLFSLQYVEKFKQFICLILLAASFHYSAIIVIFLYFFNKVQWSYSKVLFVFFIILLMTRITWLESLAQFFSLERILVYFQHDFGEWTEQANVISIIIKDMFLILFALTFKNNLKSYNLKLFNVIISSLILKIILTGIFHELYVMSNRISLYFLMARWLLFPIILCLFRGKKEYALQYFAFAFVLIVYSLSNFYIGADNYFEVYFINK